MKSLLPRILPSLCLLLALLGFVAGLCAEVTPDWCIRGIAALETGVHWTDTGTIRGKWSVSSTGDVSPWGLSPAVLADLGLTGKTKRIHSDPVYAESVVRLWLSRLYETTGDWDQAVAAWRGGLAGRNRKLAKEYAVRVRNYGSFYQ